MSVYNRLTPVYDINSGVKRIKIPCICQHLHTIDSEHIIALLSVFDSRLIYTCTFINVYEILRSCAKTDLFRIIYDMRTMLAVYALNKRTAIISGDRLVVEYQIKTSLVQSYRVKRS